jgi:hypothetical protein
MAEHVLRKAADVVAVIDLRSGAVKARAEEEYKASMHAKMVMNFMVQADFRPKWKDLIGFFYYDAIQASSKF